MPEGGASKTGRLHGRKYLCGVSDSECSGVIKSMRKRGKKLHSTPREAYLCLVRSYYRKGYTLGQNHEMIPPAGSDLPIILLPKQSKMSALRPGKESRWTPEYNCEIVN